MYLVYKAAAVAIYFNQICKINIKQSNSIHNFVFRLMIYLKNYHELSMDRKVSIVLKDYLLRLGIEKNFKGKVYKNHKINTGKI